MKRKPEDLVEMPMYQSMPPLSLYELRIERMFIPDRIEDVFWSETFGYTSALNGKDVDGTQSTEGGKMEKRLTPPKDPVPIVLQVIKRDFETMFAPPLPASGEIGRLKQTHLNQTAASNSTGDISLKEDASPSSSPPNMCLNTNLNLKLKPKPKPISKPTSIVATSMCTCSNTTSQLIRIPRTGFVFNWTRSPGDIEKNKKEVRETGRERGEKDGWPGVWVEREMEVEIMPERTMLFFFGK